MSPNPLARKNRKKIPKAYGSLPAAQEQDITVVAIGASAGGIEALSDLMSYLPVDTGMAFLLVQHLDPKHHSLLTELLARKTAMSVTEVSDGLKVRPNHIYVIPPNASISISDHTLHLGPREETRELHMSVGHFMRALAEQQGNRAIGLILSGSGSDGTLGMAEIQAHGDVTFAQGEATAKHASPPATSNESEQPAGCPSPRERQVLYLLAEGKSNKEIGMALDISSRTVEFYRARIMLKLGLHSTAALVRYAIRNNIVEA